MLKVLLCNKLRLNSYKIGVIEYLLYAIYDCCFTISILYRQA